MEGPLVGASCRRAWRDHQLRHRTIQSAAHWMCAHRERRSSLDEGSVAGRGRAGRPRLRGHPGGCWAHVSAVPLPGHLTEPGTAARPGRPVQPARRRVAAGDGAPRPRARGPAGGAGHAPGRTVEEQDPRASWSWPSGSPRGGPQRSTVLGSSEDRDRGVAEVVLWERASPPAARAAERPSQRCSGHRRCSRPAASARLAG